jgi:hypothetical protein
MEGGPWMFFLVGFWMGFWKGPASRAEFCFFVGLRIKGRMPEKKKEGCSAGSARAQDVLPGAEGMAG